MRPTFHGWFKTVLFILISQNFPENVDFTVFPHCIIAHLAFRIKITIKIAKKANTIKTAVFPQKLRT